MEQLRFFYRLFNYSEMKVQVAGFYGALMSVVCAFAEHFLGISVGLFLLLFLVMITDYATGLAASKREGGKFTSRRGLQWLFKFGSYLVILAVSLFLRTEFIANGLSWLDIPMKLIHFYVLIHIFTWELKSVDENFERLGYSFRVLKLLDGIFSMLRQMFKKRIDEH